MYDSLYGLATRSTSPRLTQQYCQNRDIDLPTTTDLSSPQRSSSSILRLDRPQLSATFVQLHSTTQPTATRIKHLAVYPRLDLHQLPSSNTQLHTSSTRPYQLSTSPIKLKTKYDRHGLYTHVCKSNNKSSSLLYLSLRLCFLHSLLLSLLTRIKLKTFAGSTCLSAP